MKRLLVSIISILLSVSLWAEAAQTISYQAIVRNNHGRLQRDANIGVRITILEGSETGTPVYTETRVAKSNVNGLLTFAIGDDAAITLDDLSKVNWSANAYYLRCEMDLEGGENYTLSSTSQMSSVPFALYAKEIAPEALPEWARGEEKPTYNYEEIVGAPTVPTKVSELTNDAGYITAAEVPAVSVPTTVSSFTNDAGYLTQHQSLEGYAKTSDLPSLDGYALKSEIPSLEDYAKKTEIPAVPTTVSSFTNDAGYLTQHQSLEEYAKKSELPTVPTKVSELTNDAGYLTNADALTVTVPSNISYFENDANYATKSELPKTDGLLSKEEASSLYQPKGNYLTNHQDLSAFALKSELPKTSDFLTKTQAATTYQVRGNYLTEHQSLAGYAKKTDIPSLEGYAKTSDLPSLEGYAKTSDLPSLEGYALKSEIPSLTGYAKTEDLPSVDTLLGKKTAENTYQPKGDYALKADIPSLDDYAKKSDVPSLEGYAKTTDIPSLDDYAKKTDIPSLEGYAKTNEIPSLEGYAKKTDIPSLEDFAKKTDLSSYAKTEDLPAIPTKVSAFENDKNYLTDQSLNGYAKKTDIPSLTEYAKKSEIPAAPTKLSDLTNDAGYITAEDVPTIEVPSLVDYAKKTDLTAYAKTSDLSSYAKTEDIPSTDTLLGKKTAENTYQPKGDYAKKSDIPSLTDYAKKTDIPSLEGYAKTEDLPSLTEYAKKSEIPASPTKLSDLTNDAGYITAEDIPSTDTLLGKKTAENTYQPKGDYAKKTDLPSLTDYAKKSDLTGYAKTEDIPSLTEYAKKSEIPAAPTKLSDLTNDAGYITAEDLPSTDTLLGKKTAANTYQPKGDYAKKTDLPSLEGYAKTSDIPSLEGYAKKTDLTAYAKTSDLPSLDGYAKTEDIPSLTEYAKKSEIPAAPTKLSELTNDAGYITAEDIPSTDTLLGKKTAANTYQPKGDYAKKADIPSLNGYAKTEDLPSLTDYAKKSDLTGYAKTSDIPAIPTKVSAFENDKNYLTDQALEGYAQTSELTAYAKKTDLTGYAKTSDLTSYATKSEVKTTTDLLLSKSAASSTYLSKTDAEDTYAKKNEQKTVTDSLLGKKEASNVYLSKKTAEDTYAKKSDQKTVTDTLLGKKEADNTYLRKKSIEDAYVKKTELKVVADTLLGKVRAANTYAKKTDIPSLDGYATSTEVKTSADTLLGKTEADTTYAKKVVLDQIQKLMEKYQKELDSLKNILSDEPASGTPQNFNTKLKTTSGGSVAAQTVSLMATPAAGYVFKEWSDGSKDVSRTVNVTGDILLTAKFELAVPGVLTGGFSVSADKKVKFSMGNLQYQASTNTFRFAENQYDIIGSVDNNDKNLNEDYEKWIDLFGWATSGYGDAKAYTPASASTVQFGPNGNKNIVGDYKDYDWGVYCAISNGGNAAGMWRTLTMNEWTYLLSRTTEDKKSLRTFATITDVTVAGAGNKGADITAVNGIILFPDNWTNENNLTIKADSDNKFNSTTNSYPNTFSAEQWAMLVSEGSVFIPFAGARNSTSINGVNTKGHYWTSTSDGAQAKFMSMEGNSASSSSSARFNGRAVRLVQDIE